MLQAVQHFIDTFQVSSPLSNKKPATPDRQKLIEDDNGALLRESSQFEVWDLNKSNHEHWIVRKDGMLWKYFNNTSEPPTLVGNVYIPKRMLTECTRLDPEKYSLRLRYCLKKIMND